jgi:DNA replication protein DnaC
MTDQSTLDRLHEMKLTKMAENYILQDKDPHLKDASFDDRFAILVDIEYRSRVTNRRKRYRKLAQLEQPEARIEEINYESGRKLNRKRIEKLVTCEYIDRALNIFITGETGEGKTYMACALGNAAIDRDIKTLFVRIPDFITEMERARQEGTYVKTLKKYLTPKLLILDEWLLIKPNEIECRDIADLIHKRRRHSSTIFCSQYDSSEWFEQLGGENNPLAESILDRIVHDAYQLCIEAVNPDQDISMREVYGLKDDDK